MPRVKRERSNAEPLMKLWDRRADKNGLLHTVYTGTGDHYSGEWRDNQKHGKGTQVWKAGAMVYDGEWQRGVRDGYGTLSKRCLSTQQLVRAYTGEWRNNKKEGSGTFFYSSSERYEGQWMDDKRGGWGRMYYKDGAVYEGEWMDDKPHGQGILQLRNGNRYEGEWKEGKKNGPGRFLYLDKGQLYDGFWVDDVAKCGTICDYEREQAPEPTAYPIPLVLLQDVQSVLMEGIRLSAKQNEVL